MVEYLSGWDGKGSEVSQCKGSKNLKNLFDNSERFPNMSRYLSISLFELQIGKSPKERITFVSASKHFGLVSSQHMTYLACL